MGVDSMALNSSGGAQIGAFSAGLGVVNAATGYLQASKTNKAIDSSISSATRAAQVQVNQLSAARDLERQKAINATRSIIGRLRAAAGGSAGPLINQAAFDGEVNKAIIGRNFEAAVGAVKSELSANVARLGSNYTSPILAAFNGGMQGVQQGLLLDNLRKPPGLGVATYGEGGNMAGPPQIDADAPPLAPLYLRRPY